MFSKMNHRFALFSIRLFSSIPLPGDGLEFLRSALHKDNIKVSSLIGATIALGATLIAEGVFVLYKVFDLEKTSNTNTIALKDLEMRIGKELRSNAKENAKELKDLERVIVFQFSNLQRDISSNRKPDEITAAALRRENQIDKSSHTEGDKK